MSAAARAEARRKAILSRGGDRLAKLTISARGDEAPFMNDATGIRSTSRNFVGEDSSDMPAPKPISSDSSPSPQPTRATPPRTSTTSSRTVSNPFENAPTPDPSVWSPEQQRQFMHALMGASATAGGPQNQVPSALQSPLGDPTDPIDPTLPPLDNPLAAMLFPQGFPGAPGPQGPAGPGGMDMGSLGALMNPFAAGGPAGGSPEAPIEPPSRLQKFLPLVHLVATWSLLAYFVLSFEPRAHSEVGGFIDGARQWSRWARLLGNGLPVSSQVVGLLQVQAVPFLWAFLTLQVTLHSMRIFTKNDTVQPPAILALALPHIPPPFPSIIINSLKYIRMISSFLDDIAILVVGFGLVVYLSSVFSS